jgi:hypothetical protein
MILSRTPDDSSSNLYPGRLASLVLPVFQQKRRKRNAVRMNLMAIQPILGVENPIAGATRRAYAAHASTR